MLKLWSSKSSAFQAFIFRDLFCHWSAVIRISAHSFSLLFICQTVHLSAGHMTLSSAVETFEQLALDEVFVWDMFWLKLFMTGKSTSETIILQQDTRSINGINYVYIYKHMKKYKVFPKTPLASVQVAVKLLKSHQYYSLNEQGVSRPALRDSCGLQLFVNQLPCHGTCLVINPTHPYPTNVWEPHLGDIISWFFLLFFGWSDHIRSTFLCSVKGGETMGNPHSHVGEVYWTN